MKNKAVKRIITGVLCLAMSAQCLPMQPVLANPTDEGLALAREIASEGIVLLKNENRGLPLKATEKVSIFGTSQIQPFYGGGGSGATSAANAITFLEALKKEGIQYNKSLVKVYQDWWDNGGKDLDYRPSGDDVNYDDYAAGTVARAEMPVTDEIISSAKEYSDTAIIMIGRAGSEGSDLQAGDLKLYPSEREMVDKVATSFEKVIVLFNTCNVQEMGWLEEYDSITSAAIIWAPGEQGMTAVAQMLNGTINPSGKLADTIAYKVEDHPSTVNFGDFALKEEDWNQKIAANIEAGVDGRYAGQTFVNYAEDIYVGYRYFETFEVPVQYEFGYGLSYTDFDVDILSWAADEEQVTVKVKVKNTGDTYAGKEVVQVYYGAPDGDMEKPEKELAAFAKTDLLAPGESQEMTLTYDTADMASYSEKEAAWVLEKGTYDIYCGTSVKQVEKAGEYQIEEDIVNKYDSATGAEIKNLFTDCRGDFTLLSKNDKENTYPETPETGTPSGSYNVRAASAEKPDFTEMEDGEEKAAVQLKDVYDTVLRNTPADTDAKKEAIETKWEEFLNQFTEEELVAFHNIGGFCTIGIERLGIPETFDSNGPSGINIRGTNGRVQEYGTAFPVTAMLAATWNLELAEEFGRVCAKEANDMDMQIWYAPGMNMHRNPMGGRNFEYFSEDPIVTGTMASAITVGSQSEGVIVTLKHFALNDMDTNRAGVQVYASERAMREIYLKPFEIAIKEGHALGIMSAYSLIGETWTGSSKALLTDLIRTEWGFEGFVVSDAWAGNVFQPAVEAAYNGGDLMLGFGYNPSTYFAELESENHDAFVDALKLSTRHVLTAVMKTKAFSDVIGNEGNIGVATSELFEVAKKAPVDEQASELQKKAEEAQKQAEIAKQQAEEAIRKAEEAQNKANAQAKELEELRKRAEEAVKKAEEAQKEAEKAKEEAEKARNKTVITVKKKITVKKGKKAKLNVKVNTSKKITYRSANKKIARVNKKGVIRGVKKGKTKVTIKCNGITKSVRVVVK